MNRERKELEERLVARAAAVLGLAPDQVLFQTGYKTSNKDKGRRAAAMAELRAAVFLKEQGFSDIRLVSPSNKPTADILASRGRRTYAFEVQCITRQSSFSAVNHKVGINGEVLESFRDPESVLVAKFRQKIKQANASRKRGKLDRSAVVLVIDSPNFSPFICGGDLAGLARAAYEGAGAPQGAHACVLADGDAGVWPPWG